MLHIQRAAVEHLTHGCVTDAATPRFSCTAVSDRPGAALQSVTFALNGWQTTVDTPFCVPYAGPALQPFTRYTVAVTAVDDAGEKAAATVDFETGRLDTPWTGVWISDAEYAFKEDKVSPKPMVFRKAINLSKPVATARLYATAMGIYEAALNGEKIGDQYFAPGFTSYKTNLQYQVYDVTERLTGHDVLEFTVAGGWAVGSFVFTRKNRVSADRQALLAELRVTYTDGSTEVIGTDAGWQVTEEGPVTMADIYDGETYDATIDLDRVSWRSAAPEKLRVTPRISAGYGAPVREHEHFAPRSCTKVEGEYIYDFGQNFAGVVRLHIKNAQSGQLITVRHAEILNPDGTLNTAFLRTAKATATYICRDGTQEYSPRLTYMGFRYISIRGIEPEAVEVEGIALYSELRQTGSFRCSDPMLNQLQSNILWGAKSNFVDIPTDCPQRDERMGWTGDIAVFSPVACAMFDMSRFLEKWLLDVQNEQLPTGGIPNTVPVQGYGFPATMPKMAVDWWGDACVLVPWNEYQTRGDLDLLRRMYPTMKKYVNACKFWAGIGFGKHRYIWHTPSMLHFGDWVAPDVPQMSQWQGRSRYTATASLRNTSRVLAKVAALLGYDEDAKEYAAYSDKVADAYISVFTDGQGKMREEFQTGYVLPLYLKMFPEAQRKAAVDHLVALVERMNYCIGTGFPGTPYILFALADNGRADVAYKMLLNQQCPSWLYEVRVGATTVWERWDGLDENGVCPIGDDGTDKMISYNHYASGAVADFLYRRVAGLEPTSAGYRTFKFQPLPGGGLTSAEVRIETPFGEAAGAWKADGERFTVTVTVPMGTTCEVVMPSGKTQTLGSGTHTVTE